MKQGRTLQELAIEIQRRGQAKKDYIADTRSIFMQIDDTGTPKLEMHGRGSNTPMFDINEVAHQQIGTKLGIPGRYYQRMLEECPTLLADNVNHWMDKGDGKQMVRTLDGTARAFLSDKYRILDNDSILATVLPELLNIPDLQIASCEVTDEKMYLKVLNPRIQADVKVGDTVQAGMIISNSEVGKGTLTVQPLVYRLVCSNGMIVNKAGQRTRHLGKANEFDANYEVFTSETRELDNKAYLAKLRDIVRAVTSDVHFNMVVDMMKEAQGVKITAQDIPGFVELACTDRRFGLTKSESEGVLRHLIMDGDLTLFGLSNAVTRFSQDVKSYDRATELESIGYDILGMPAGLWKQLNMAEMK